MPFPYVLLLQPVLGLHGNLQLLPLILQLQHVMITKGSDLFMLGLGCRLNLSVQTFGGLNTIVHLIQTATIKKYMHIILNNNIQSIH